MGRHRRGDGGVPMTRDGRLVEVDCRGLLVGDVVYTANHEFVEIESLSYTEFICSWVGWNVISGFPVTWNGRIAQVWRVRRDSDS